MKADATMKRFRGRSVSICARIGLPIQLAWEGLRAYLNELERHPGETSFHVLLGGPVEARVAIPIKIATADGNSRYERVVRIEAASQEAIFPIFYGVIWLMHSLETSCDLRLEGKYRVPLNFAGSVIDMTLFRDAAEQSLERFLAEVAENIAHRVKVVVS